MIKYKRKRKQNNQEYITTSFFTFFIVLVFAIVFLILDSLHEISSFSDKNINEYDSNLILYNIELILEKDNYHRNPKLLYKLGVFNEMILQFDVAEDYYKKSYEASKKTYYLPVWDLAKLQLGRKKYVDAEKSILEIKDKNSKKLKLKKGIFYRNLAEAYNKLKKYEEAVRCINKSLIYLDKTNENEYKNSKEVYAMIVIQKSKDYLLKKELQKAIDELERIKDEYKSADLYYRLGLLYLDKNPQQALSYFEKAKLINPIIINYTIYFELLNNLIQNKNISEIDRESYKRKIKNLESFINKNFVFKDEFEIKNIRVIKKSKFLFFQREEFLIFDIENKSDFLITKLFAEINFYKQQETMIVDKKIINFSNRILPHSTRKNIEVLIPQVKDKKVFEKIDYKGNIYLYKNKKFNKIENARFNL